MSDARKTTTTIRLSDDEGRMVRRIQAHHGLTGLGAVVRFLLVKEMRELGATRKVGKA